MYFYRVVVTKWTIIGVVGREGVLMLVLRLYLIKHKKERMKEKNGIWEESTLVIKIEIKSN